MSHNSPHTTSDEDNAHYLEDIMGPVQQIPEVSPILRSLKYALNHLDNALADTMPM